MHFHSVAAIHWKWNQKGWRALFLFLFKKDWQFILELFFEKNEISFGTFSFYPFEQMAVILARLFGFPSKCRFCFDRPNNKEKTGSAFPHVHLFDGLGMNVLFLAVRRPLLARSRGPVRVAGSRGRAVSGVGHRRKRGRGGDAGFEWVRHLSRLIWLAEW